MILRERVKGEKLYFKSARGVYEFGLTMMKLSDKSDEHKERFYVIGLNSKNNLEYVELCSIGILNASLVHPREIFHMAVIKQVNAIIILHNHPSGEPEPSEEDNKITRAIYAAGDTLGIQLLDHVIMGDETFYSYREENRLHS